MKDNMTAATISDTLATDIHTGLLAPGDMLPSERELCDRFDVGRNVVREALTVLQAMGLTENPKGKRPRVIAPTLDKLMGSVAEAAKYFFQGSEGKAHLEQARLFLETSMIRYAVEHATNAHIGRMVEAIDRCEAALDNPEEYRNADVSFHRILAEIPGNPIFIALHETFVKQLMKSRPLMEDFAVRSKIGNQEHRQIVRAIIDKQPDKAVAALTKHLTRNYGAYFRKALDR